MNQSKELTQFYRSYAGWLDDGAKEGMVFGRGYGLCHNLTMWPHTTKNENSMLSEMIAQFLAAGLDDAYPFNDTATAYFNEAMEKTIHLNEARIKWVREHAQ